MWSYSGDPGTSERDQVRFYVQDVNPAEQLLTDEEIDFLLGQWAAAAGSPLYVAAVAAEIIAGKFATLVGVSADGVNVDMGALTAKYNDLASSLRDQYHALYASQGPLMQVMADFANDPTIPALTFGVGFQDNFDAGRQDYGERGELRATTPDAS